MMILFWAKSVALMLHILSNNNAVFWQKFKQKRYPDEFQVCRSPMENLVSLRFLYWVWSKLSGSYEWSNHADLSLFCSLNDVADDSNWDTWTAGLGSCIISTRNKLTMYKNLNELKNINNQKLVKEYISSGSNKFWKFKACNLYNLL